LYHKGPQQMALFGIDRVPENKNSPAGLVVRVEVERPERTFEEQITLLGDPGRKDHEAELGSTHPKVSAPQRLATSSFAINCSPSRLSLILHFLHIHTQCFPGLRREHSLPLSDGRHLSLSAPMP